MRKTSKGRERLRILQRPEKDIVSFSRKRKTSYPSEERERHRILQSQEKDFRSNRQTSYPSEAIKKLHILQKKEKDFVSFRSKRKTSYPSEARDRLHILELWNNVLPNKQNPDNSLIYLSNHGKFIQYLITYS